MPNSVHKKVLFVSFFIATSFFVTATAHAATYYVAQNGGSDGNTCSADNPNSAKATINGGISCLRGGDTLVVKPGTYAELINDNIPSGTAGNPTIVRSETQ
jgi:hypothetical protein